MIFKCQASYFWRASARSRGSCIANLLSWEKQLLLSFNTNGKDSTWCSLPCILYTGALNTDPYSCPPEVKPRPMPYSKHSPLYYNQTRDTDQTWPVKPSTLLPDIYVDTKQNTPYLMWAGRLENLLGDHMPRQEVRYFPLLIYSLRF